MLDLETADLGALEAVMETDKGTIVLGFHAQHAPGHVKNFLTLVQKGFYDGLAFHRIVKNFMVQGGCPNTRAGARGTPGTGDPGYKIAAEFNDLPHHRGSVSMARSREPNSAGSQFFLVHAPHAGHLDGQYTNFGYVKLGLDVLDSIANVAVDFGPGGERSKPVQRVGVRSVCVRAAELPAQAEGQALGAEANDQEAGA